MSTRNGYTPEQLLTKTGRADRRKFYEDREIAAAKERAECFERSMVCRAGSHDRCAGNSDLRLCLCTCHDHCAVASA